MTEIFPGNTHEKKGPRNDSSYGNTIQIWLTNKVPEDRLFQSSSEHFSSLVIPGLGRLLLFLRFFGLRIIHFPTLLLAG